MNATWIVVANQVGARILAYRRGEPLREIETLVCLEGRQPDREMLTAAPGRSHDRMGPARHAMEPRTNVGKQITESFTHRIAERLEAGRKHDAFQGLVLVAAPRFLGMLRDALSVQCIKKVVGEYRRNIVTLGAEEILASLPVEIKREIDACGSGTTRAV